MKLKYGASSVLEKVEISKGVFKLTIEVGFNAKPGEVLFLKSSEKKPFLSRPLRVYEAEKKKIAFLCESGGEGINLISRLEKGDEVEIICPLGHKIRNTAVSA